MNGMDKQTREQIEQQRRARRFTNWQAPTISRRPTNLRQLEAEEQQRERDRQQEALAAPLRKVEEQLQAEAREITRRVKAFYSLDLSEMAGFPVEAAPTDYGDFQTRHTRRNARREAEVYWEFRNALAERGTTLTAEGWNRLGSWVSAQIANGDVEPTPAVWQHGLDRLASLGCFHADELHDYYAPVKPVPQPVVQPEPTFDEAYEAIDTSTRAGAAAAKALVIQENYKDIRSAWHQFGDECRVLFFGKEFTTEEIQSMTRIADARSLNANTTKGWHTARVLAVRNETVRPVFLTPDEALAWRYDKNEFDTSTFEGRQKYQREVAKLQGRI